MSRGLDDPCSGRIRDAVGAPLIHSYGKSFLGRFLRQVKIAERADQRGDDASPVGAIDFINSRICY